MFVTFLMKVLRLFIFFLFLSEHERKEQQLEFLMDIVNNMHNYQCVKVYSQSIYLFIVNNKHNYQCVKVYHSLSIYLSVYLSIVNYKHN